MCLLLRGAAAAGAAAAEAGEAIQRITGKRGRRPQEMAINEKINNEMERKRVPRRGKKRVARSPAAFLLPSDWNLRLYVSSLPLPLCLRLCVCVRGSIFCRLSLSGKLLPLLRLTSVFSFSSLASPHSSIPESLQTTIFSSCR